MLQVNFGAKGQQIVSRYALKNPKSFYHPERSE